jgi:hypothetical protein
MAEFDGAQARTVLIWPIRLACAKLGRQFVHGKATQATCCRVSSPKEVLADEPQSC